MFQMFFQNIVKKSNKSSLPDEIFWFDSSIWEGMHFADILSFFIKAKQ